MKSVKGTKTSGKLSKRLEALKPSWNPLRLSGKLNLRRRSGGSEGSGVQELEDEATKPNFKLNEKADPYALQSPKREERCLSNCTGCGNQFHNYCQLTSLHGFRYITEKHRNFSER